MLGSGGFRSQDFVVLLEREMSGLLCPLSWQVQFDVVVSAYALSELPSRADRIEVVQNLWRKTSHFLVS